MCIGSVPRLPSLALPCLTSTRRTIPTATASPTQPRVAAP